MITKKIKKNPAKKELKKKKEKKCLCSKLLCFWNLLAKIIAVGVILIWIIMVIQQNKGYQQELREYQALEVFAKIDDMAHEQYAEMEATWNPYNRTWAKEFLAIDNWYHNAKTLKEKYKRAKKLNDLSVNIIAWLEKIWGITSSGDIARYKKYLELEPLFKSLEQ